MKFSVVAVVVYVVDLKNFQFSVGIKLDLVLGGQRFVEIPEKAYLPVKLNVLFNRTEQKHKCVVCRNGIVIVNVGHNCAGLAEGSRSHRCLQCKKGVGSGQRPIKVDVAEKGVFF